jgi:NAD-dependent SIR2 family protein deacetylase
MQAADSNLAVQDHTARIKRAAQAIKSADALLIGAGAGMSVDSGLPDFRGTTGFWKAYPPFRGKTYAEIASPNLMENDPHQAWGFYAHCMKLYRETTPHAGFQTIKRWTKQISGNYFVFTSNVDGHFAREGFEPERILEIHGSNHFMQCSRGLQCSPQIWSADEVNVEVDEETFRAVGELPRCKNCDAISRPNLLMFGDKAWIPLRTAQQENFYTDWSQSVKNKNVVAIEFGAGTAVPTVRYECQKRSRTLIRVNPRDYIGPAEAISIPLRALETINAIDEFLRE